MTLRPDFLCYSPGSRRLFAFEEADNEDTAAPFGAQGTGRAVLIAECERTASAIAAAAPGRIARGSLTREDADRQAAAFRAIGADIAAELGHFQALWREIAAGTPWHDRALHPGAAPSPFLWEDKLHVLRREIHMRRTYDPDRIAKGRLAPADAAAQLERLEAVQDKYWSHLFAWSSPTGAAAGSPALRAEVAEHARLLELSSSADAGAGQEEAIDQAQEALPV